MKIMSSMRTHYGTRALCICCSRAWTSPLLLCGSAMKAPRPHTFTWKRILQRRSALLQKWRRLTVSSSASSRMINLWPFWPDYDRERPGALALGHSEIPTSWTCVLMRVVNSYPEATRSVRSMVQSASKCYSANG